MTVTQLARELGANERSLRRALNDGLLHARRPSPRKVDLPVAGRAYLRRNARFLFALREALRTEPGVALVVLFGSRARGDHEVTSDIDLLVAGRPNHDLRALSERLARRFGAPVQVVSLEDAKKNPRLLAEVVREGRVLVDRDRTWPSLRARSTAIANAAAREQKRIANQFNQTFGSSA